MIDDHWTCPAADIDKLKVHPMHVVDEADMMVVELWRAWQGARGTTGFLPDVGGMTDQAAWLMAAFLMCDEVERRVAKQRQGKGG